MATIKRKCDVCDKEYEADTRNIKRVGWLENSRKGLIEYKLKMK